MESLILEEENIIKDKFLDEKRTRLQCNFGYKKSF